MTTAKRIAAIVLFCLSVGTACHRAADYGNSDLSRLVGPVDLYYGFRLVDPVKERIIENAYVVVAGGRIAKVGSGTPPQGRFEARHDMAGRYALPGMIDAHAHITAGPHVVDRRDGAPAITIESVDEITRFSARIALAFGITTVRNPGGDPIANARYNERIASGEWIGPDAVHAGAVIQPPPFTGGAFAYPKTEEEWRAEAARQAALGMTYFKLYAGLSEEELATGIRVAHEHGLQAIAHLNGVSWMRAVELGIDGLEHALPTSPDLLEPKQRAAYLAGLTPDSRFYFRWFELADYDGPLIRQLIHLLVKKQIALNMTFSVQEVVFHADDLNRLFPARERRYSHPANLKASLALLQAGAAEWSKDDFARARAVMPKVLEFGRRLHQAGAAMMLGTDGTGGGPYYARELALHVRAGISAWDVLRLATSGGAEAMGLTNRTGRIAPGLEADIVFLKRDPVENVANVRAVEVVVTNGNAFRFEELTRDAG